MAQLASGEGEEAAGVLLVEDGQPELGRRRGQRCTIARARGGGDFSGDLRRGFGLGASRECEEASACARLERN